MSYSIVIPLTPTTSLNTPFAPLTLCSVSRELLSIYVDKVKLPLPLVRHDYDLWDGNTNPNSVLPLIVRVDEVMEEAQPTV